MAPEEHPGDRHRPSSPTRASAGARRRHCRRAPTPASEIYYYFGDKERLFAEVLEEAYSRHPQIEASLELDQIEPESALAGARRIHVRLSECQ